MLFCPRNFCNITFQEGGYYDIFKPLEGKFKGYFCRNCTYISKEKEAKVVYLGVLGADEKSRVRRFGQQVDTKY